MALTLEQKTLLAQILKDNTENFTSPMELKVVLPVKVGVNEETNEDIIENHTFALTNILITRHDMTAESQYPNEYDTYDEIVLN